MLGQTIVARFSGPSPSASFLTRVRTGQVGGVILFGENLSGGQEAARRVTAQLQRAAEQGGNPPLLIMTDQEGGTVKRLSWAPPALAANAMGSSALARSEGKATGRALRSVGINLDLAPVADVERLTGSFLGTRSFGSDPAAVASRACAFAEGVASEGVAFTLKHFPGLGRASTSTDTASTTVDATANSLRADYQAYRRCGADRGAIVMIDSAIYPRLTGTAQPAVLSAEIYREELPYATGGVEPLTISDDLQTSTILNESAPAQRALNAGLDLLMYAQTETGSATAYSRLLSAVRSGALNRDRLATANQALGAFKHLLAGQSREAPPSPQASSAGEAEASVSSPTTVGQPVTIKPRARSGAGGD